MNDYIQEKININQLFALAEYYGKKVATKKEIENTLNNKFMLSVLCDEHKITVKNLTKKLNKILNKL